MDLRPLKVQGIPMPLPACLCCWSQCSVARVIPERASGLVNATVVFAYIRERWTLVRPPSACSPHTWEMSHLILRTSRGAIARHSAFSSSAGNTATLAPVVAYPGLPLVSLSFWSPIHRLVARAIGTARPYGCRARWVAGLCGSATDAAKVISE